MVSETIWFEAELASKKEDEWSDMWCDVDVKCSNDAWIHVEARMDIENHVV